MHALITGRKDERDRRIAIIAAPRFGIVGQVQTITYRLDDQGVSGERAKVAVRRDGETINERTVLSGETVNVDIDIKHAGPNIVEIEASPLENELTPVNNRAVVAIDGVRDKLRVLLVSGEPHSGERTWRNLLKSDASVDLVHFTILRPPEKQDGTPINELSLIAFPTRELFQQRINEFQLIIFDRYARQGVLPIAYFDNIARYVRAGGAVLVSAGPDYASTTSIWRTPLDSVLPAEPVGVTEKPYYAHLSDIGKRHPVTRGLEGSGTEPPHWSRFFRTVETRNATSPPVMTGADGKPLLLLSRYGEGRVALLLTDHIWLWARGYEGGGPHLDLLRRTSHWLMKQPDLDEESVAGNRWHAESLDQCRPDQPEGIFGSHLYQRDAETAGASHRRRRKARHGWLKPRPAAHRAGSCIQYFSWRWLDGREDAQCECRQRRRRAAAVRRPDRLAALAWRVRRDLAARGALITILAAWLGLPAWRGVNHTPPPNSADTRIDHG